MGPNTVVYLGTVALISFVLKCTILLNARIDSWTSQAFKVRHQCRSVHRECTPLL